MKALVFGHVCIDNNVLEGKSYTAAGGSAVFINKVLAQFDCQTTIAAPYGKDFLPYAKDIVLYPEKSRNENTLIYENIIKNNLRAQKALNRPDNFNIEITEELVEKIKQADIIFIAPLFPNVSSGYIRRINDIARKETLMVLLPQGYFRDFDLQNNVIIREFSEANEVLPFVDIVVASEQDHPQIKQLARTWAKLNNAAIIITLAERGALVIASGGEKHIPTIPAVPDEIVAPVGCGDVFSAGLAYYYKKSGALEESVNFANKLARQHLLGQLS